ncbi:MAG TPA: thioredoxin domain-containing protein [Longimicrobium sp.]|nr:thioredoxin domain-containing protein [Longimicrobium sp.]
MPNRLANETSPYLLQHRDNPVDWYPWGPEALARAKADGRPILLSVGYSACHWCHVMEHESFEDAQTAALMNELFVNIKVDREERPDIDSIYMAAVQQMTGRGGWPMTVFLTPEGAPFYGGTYYPPEPRYGMPSFRQVLAGVADAWSERRGDVDQSAADLTEAVRQGTDMRPPPGALDSAVLDQAFAGLASRFDFGWGGLAGAPKFPQPMTIDFVLRTWKRTGNPDALRWVEVTLRRMASGGIYDHLGGGFARYSVDAHWLVPHFEKMLYDNALLVPLYLNAWQATGSEEYRAVAEDVLGWVMREMTSPEGGFYSALDADSEGEEGRFYVWTPAQIDEVLGREEGAIVRAWYGVTEPGNFEERNILHAWRTVEAAAAEAGVTPERLMDAVSRARQPLYTARAARVWPGRDDKILTAWNAMMLRAFAEAGRILGSDAYRRIAVASAEFLLAKLRVDGRLQRTYKDGRAKIAAFLDDHALLAGALVSLYEATFDARWLREARALMDETLERFWDEDEGVFYDTATDAEPLVVRPRDLWDNATPSGSSAAIHALLRLAELLGEERYRRIATRALEGTAELAGRVPAGFGLLLSALDFHLSTPVEIAFVGTPGEAETEALLDVAARAYLPNAVTALRRPAEDGAVEELVPLLRGRTARGGQATAYVCERLACRQPVNEPAELAEQLGARNGAG